MTYTELLVELRVEIADSDKTEWEDSELMSFLRRAMKRIDAIIVKNKLQFAILSFEITILADTAVYALPADFGIQNGLYRQDTAKRLSLLVPDEWERITYAGDGAWTIMGTDIHLNCDIAEDQTIKLYYFPEEQYSTASTDDVRYGSKIWDILLGYAAFLCKNIDEMDTSIDVQALAEIELQMITRHLRNRPQVASLSRLV